MDNFSRVLIDLNVFLAALVGCSTYRRVVYQSYEKAQNRNSELFEIKLNLLSADAIVQSHDIGLISITEGGGGEGGSRSILQNGLTLLGLPQSGAMTTWPIGQV